MVITKWKNSKTHATIPSPSRCPLCGETKPFKIGNAGGVEGIEHVWFKRKITRFFDLYKYTICKYRCHSCGAEWKSNVTKEYIEEEL